MAFFNSRKTFRRSATVSEYGKRATADGTFYDLRRFADCSRTHTQSQPGDLFICRTVGNQIPPRTARQPRAASRRRWNTAVRCWRPGRHRIRPHRLRRHEGCAAAGKNGFAAGHTRVAAQRRCRPFCGPRKLSEVCEDILSSPHQRRKRYRPTGNVKTDPVVAARIRTPRILQLHGWLTIFTPARLRVRQWARVSLCRSTTMPQQLRRRAACNGRFLKAQRNYFVSLDRKDKQYEQRRR